MINDTVELASRYGLVVYIMNKKICICLDDDDARFNLREKICDAQFFTLNSHLREYGK